MTTVEPDATRGGRDDPARRRFVTFEGVDGAGKSTHLAWFAETLRAQTGGEVVLTREPGGTLVGEAIREVVLRTPMDLETETLLMFASRRENVQRTILPALERGAWVVCDRFTDATRAYQGAGRGLPDAAIDVLRDWVHPGLAPGTTVLFDLAPDLARARIAGQRDTDRFEDESAAFFARVRDRYLAMAAAEPRRYRVIDGSRSLPEVRHSLEEVVASLCSA